MHIPKFKLYRMGSDPEVLFVRPVDFDYVITPAYDVLGRDKKKTTSSFIGTDSRPVIAEIRPNPSRNLKRHLYEVAYAIVTTQDYLDTSARWKGLKMLAYPHLHNENLGGHIHASFFIDDPLYLKLKQYGLTFGGGGNYIASIGGQEAQRNRDLEAEVVNAIMERRCVTPLIWGQALGWLLGPFEKWVQPWVPREVRNAHYGANASADLVRLGVSKPPYNHPGAYVHWEYRMPSTWLQHPWLAYAYLGLAKLAMLNMPTVLKFWWAENPKDTQKKPSVNEGELIGAGPPPTQFNIIKTGDPGEAGRVLRDNLAKLMPRARMSNDLRNLAGVIEKCAENRVEWFRRPTPVDVEAWRKLL